MTPGKRPRPFVHLHRHSEYSLLDGLGTAWEYSLRAAEAEQEALAITDHGTLSGILHHIEACKGLDKEGKEKIHEPLKAIVGIEAYFRPDRLKHDAENKEYYHMVLLAKGMDGYRSLLRIASEAHREESFYYKPCIDADLLRRFHEGLIASTTCLSGYLPSSIMNGDDKGANDYLEFMKTIFKDDLFVEIQPHDFP